MGDVVTLEGARARAGLDTSFIDEAYRALETLPDFTRRPGQSALSARIQEALVLGRPLAAEAPTGTGKTIAYLVGALAARANRPDAEPLPIVVATATVGLQQQVLTGDLPRLTQAKLLHPGDAVIAKGRGRYLCVLTAERLVQQAMNAGQFDFFDVDTREASEIFDTAQAMLRQFLDGSWTGDRDSYEGPMPPEAGWARLAASPDTCINRRCAHYETCPFFRDRRRMALAKIVIANHDLVLSDLKMSQSGEQDALFPASKYLVIFDEAHNLPDKALNAGSAQLELEAAQLALMPLPGFAGKLFRDPDIANRMRYRELDPTSFEPGPALAALARAARAVRALPPEDPDSTIVRLGRDPLPTELERALLAAHGELIGLEARLAQALTGLRNSKLPETKPSIVPLFTEILFQAAHFGTRLKDLCSALDTFLKPNRVVRWLDHDAARARLHVSPLEGADFLRNVLWKNERAVPALVSATLRTFGHFDRFRDRAGLPDSTLTHAVEPIFNYRASTLVTATWMKYTPKFAERPQFEAEVTEALPQFVREGDASLILFPSKRLLQRALPTLAAHFGEAVLVQGEMPFSKLIQTHRERTDGGRTSVLCGLATLAEGLDLPGRYCVHVVIVALPFSVPTSPVELELQEHLGRRYFAERALPDTQMRLVQMVGRLIRRESDRGRITVLDKRLSETWWGRQMRDDLPPFEKRAERIGDRQVPAAAGGPATRTPARGHEVPA